MGTGREYWLRFSCGCSQRGLAIHLRGVFAHRSGAGAWKSCIAEDWNCWGSCGLSLYSMSFLHISVPGSWTSSMVAEGFWNRCPKGDRQNLSRLESHPQSLLLPSIQRPALLTWKELHRPLDRRIVIELGDILFLFLFLIVVKYTEHRIYYLNHF